MKGAAMSKATTKRQQHTAAVMDRVGAFSGATYFVLASVAIAVGSDPELPDEPTGQESLDGLNRLAAKPLAQATISLEFLAFVAWMVFVAYVAWRVRAAGWLAAVVLVAGITEIAVKVGSCWCCSGNSRSACPGASPAVAPRFQPPSNRKTT
jgi:hypothetical protein